MTAIEDLLQRFGVDVGEPIRRAEKAGRLESLGFEVADLDIAFTHLEAHSEAGKGPRLIAFMAMNPERLRATIVDCRAFQEARGQRKDGRAPGDAKHVPGPTQGETQEAWEHDRMCRIAWCRVHGDHRSREEVARELGVSVTTLGTMLDRGRVLSASPIVPTSTVAPTSPAAAQREERATEQRVQEWRGRMRADGERARFQRGQAKGLPDWRRMDEAKGSILAGVRHHGVVDLGAVMRDPTARGALAELEYAGAILRAGEPDAQQRQPYQAARNDEERKRFREQFLVWARADMDRPRQAVPHG